MKKERKRISMITLIILLGNMFLGDAIPVVEALTSGEVYNYANNIASNITNIDEKIGLSKESDLYNTDSSYNGAVNYIKDTVDALKNNLEETNEVLDSGVSLKALVNNYFSDRKTTYETYFEQDIIIDLNNIIDITYTYHDELDPSTPILGTLLTKEEIAITINNNYLKDLSDQAINYNNNYDSTITSLQTDYNSIITLINEKIEELETKKAEIELFEENESLLGNNPLMNVNEISIYTLIETSKTELENEKLIIDLNKLVSKTDIINNIYDDCKQDINEFWNNNKSYIENGLKGNIIDFETNINSINTRLSDMFLNIDDFKNSNINNYIINNDLITLFKDIITIENDYIDLKSNINTYLERKASDTDTINNLLSLIEEERLYINKEHILNDIALIVDNVDLTDESIIDTLYNFLDIVDLNQEVKNKIINAKLSLYPLLLINESNYQMELKGDNLVLINLKDKLSITDFNNNLNYGNFSKLLNETTDNVTNNTKVLLYDKNNKLIKTYNIVIKGDVNKDNIIDLNDIDNLKEIIIHSNKFSEEDLLRMDLNNDFIIDILDLNLLNNFINVVTSGNTTEAELKITRETNDGLICYAVNLKTNGIVTGISFNINNSNNLIFNNIKDINTLINVNDIITPSKIIGLGNYSNGNLLINLCFKEDISKDLTTQTFSISNIKLVFDNENYEEIDNIINTSVKVETTKSSSNNISNTNEVETEEESDLTLEEVKDELKKDSSTDEEKEEKTVVVSNVIKIVVIVLLGAVIIYFLNKKDNDEDIFEEKPIKKA